MKALLLLSGGLDSPVAGYLMQKKGYIVDAIHFSYAPLTDNGPEEKSMVCAKKLNIKNVYVINIAQAATEIAKKAQHRFYFILTKRFMLALAQKCAQENKYDVLITGESLGQVSSQTLANLEAITVESKIPVLRPLLTRDKIEIMKIAKQIDTYDAATGPEVCDALGPKNPATKAKINLILSEEKRYDKNAILEKAYLTLCKQKV